MEGELKLLLRQFKHRATSTYSYLIASKLNNAILIDPVKEEIKKSFKEKELQNVLKKGEKIEKRKYEGCPRHKTKASDNILDMFA